MRLSEIRDLAHRFVPQAAADRRLYECGPRSWWPAHEIGHFLVATADECRQPRFGIDDEESPGIDKSWSRYAIAKEIAATSISQRLLRRSGHGSLAVDEIQYTDEHTLECAFEAWCERAVQKLLRANKTARLPSTRAGLEALLARKARVVATAIYPSRRAAEAARDRAHTCWHCSTIYDRAARRDCPECGRYPWL